MSSYTTHPLKQYTSHSSDGSSQISPSTQLRPDYDEEPPVTNVSDLLNLGWDSEVIFDEEPIPDLPDISENSSSLQHVTHRLSSFHYPDDRDMAYHSSRNSLMTKSNSNNALQELGAFFNQRPTSPRLQVDSNASSKRNSSNHNYYNQNINSSSSNITSSERHFSSSTNSTGIHKTYPPQTKTTLPKPPSQQHLRYNESPLPRPISRSTSRGSDILPRPPSKGSLIDHPSRRGSKPTPPQQGINPSPTQRFLNPLPQTSRIITNSSGFSHTVSPSNKITNNGTNANRLPSSASSGRPTPSILQHPNTSQSSLGVPKPKVSEARQSSFTEIITPPQDGVADSPITPISPHLFPTTKTPIKEKNTYLSDDHRQRSTSMKQSLPDLPKHNAGEMADFQASSKMPSMYRENSSMTTKSQQVEQLQVQTNYNNPIKIFTPFNVPVKGQEHKWEKKRQQQEKHNSKMFGKPMLISNPSHGRIDSRIEIISPINVSDPNSANENLETEITTVGTPKSSIPLSPSKSVYSPSTMSAKNSHISPKTVYSRDNAMSPLPPLPPLVTSIQKRPETSSSIVSPSRDLKYNNTSSNYSASPKIQGMSGERPINHRANKSFSPNSEMSGMEISPLSRSNTSLFGKVAKMFGKQKKVKEEGQDENGAFSAMKYQRDDFYPSTHPQFSSQSIANASSTHSDGGSSDHVVFNGRRINQIVTPRDSMHFAQPTSQAYVPDNFNTSNDAPKRNYDLASYLNEHITDRNDENRRSASRSYGQYENGDSYANERRPDRAPYYAAHHQMNSQGQKDFQKTFDDSENKGYGIPSSKKSNDAFHALNKQRRPETPEIGGDQHRRLLNNIDSHWSPRMKPDDFSSTLSPGMMASLHDESRINGNSALSFTGKRSSYHMPKYD